MKVASEEEIKILLLGANGQLGQTFLNPRPGSSFPINWSIQPCTRSQLDIGNDSALDKFLTQTRPDIIINAAAYTAVDLAESNQQAAFRINQQAVEYISRWVDKNSVRLIHISTDFVFAGEKCTPYTTTDKTDPKSIYGRSKLAGEAVIRKIIPTRATIIRTAWLYSAYGNNFLKTMLRLMREKDSLSVVSDQVGTPCSTHTLVECIRVVINKKSFGQIFHCTDLGQASWYDFALAIQEEAQATGLLKNAIPIKPISTADYPLPANRPRYSELDKSSTVEQLKLSLQPWRVELKKVIKDISLQQKL